jgi:hypothetical protein
MLVRKIERLKGTKENKRNKRENGEDEGRERDEGRKGGERGKSYFSLFRNRGFPFRCGAATGRRGGDARRRGTNLFGFALATHPMPFLAALFDGLVLKVGRDQGPIVYISTAVTCGLLLDETTEFPLFIFRPAISGQAQPGRGRSFL